MSSSESDVMPPPVLPLLVLGLATLHPPPQLQGENRSVSERLVILSPLTASMIVIDGDVDLDLSNKDGPLPASKASIDSMPSVKTTEEGQECSICLGDLEVGAEAKEMPCKHRFHSNCIEKWLGLRGSCPVCRFKMPVEEEEEREQEQEGGHRGTATEGLRARFFFGVRGAAGGSANGSEDMEMVD